jgi:hypothetical protein
MRSNGITCASRRIEASPGAEPKRIGFAAHRPPCARRTGRRHDGRSRHRPRPSTTKDRGGGSEPFAVDSAQPAHSAKTANPRINEAAGPPGTSSTRRQGFDVPPPGLSSLVFAICLHEGSKRRTSRGACGIRVAMTTDFVRGIELGRDAMRAFFGAVAASVARTERRSLLESIIRNARSIVQIEGPGDAPSAPTDDSDPGDGQRTVRSESESAAPTSSGWRPDLH